MRLEQALGQWRHWQGERPLAAPPEITQLFDAGLSNAAVQVTASDGQTFVVRIDGGDPARHLLDRQREWHCQRLAYEAGLAPRPCYFNPQLGVMVSEYLVPDTTAKPTPEAVAGLLRAIHALPSIHYRLDIPQRIKHYQQQAQARLPQYRPQWEQAEHQARQYLQDYLEDGPPASTTIDTKVVLCHNDLLAANRLFSQGRLVAIDWEYCAMGQRWFDLAAVCWGDDWRPGERQRLVDHYLNRPARDEELAYLCRQGWVYRYLELLWHCAEDKPGDWQQGFTVLDRLPSLD